MSRGCGAGAVIVAIVCSQKMEFVTLFAIHHFFFGSFFQKILSFWGGLLHKSGVNEQNEKWKTTKGGFTVQEMICKCWVLHIGVYS